MAFSDNYRCYSLIVHQYSTSGHFFKDLLQNGLWNYINDLFVLLY